MSEDVTKDKTLIETLALGTESFELCGFKESLFSCYIADSLLYCELSLTLLKKFFLQSKGFTCSIWTVGNDTFYAWNWNFDIGSLIIIN